LILKLLWVTHGSRDVSASRRCSGNDTMGVPVIDVLEGEFGGVWMWEGDYYQQGWAMKNCAVFSGLSTPQHQCGQVFCVRAIRPEARLEPPLSPISHGNEGADGTARKARRYGRTCDEASVVSRVKIDNN